ncbi:MAG: hypothetical protein HYS34_11050, partial [Acidobacteria bacterium]|nr:hypothetical protein [Acidobacteriota bacterium]
VDVEIEGLLARLQSDREQAELARAEAERMREQARAQRARINAELEALDERKQAVLERARERSEQELAALRRSAQQVLRELERGRKMGIAPEAASVASAAAERAEALRPVLAPARRRKR